MEITWPYVLVWTAAAQRTDAPGRFQLRLQCAGYPTKGPTGALWNPEKNTPFDHAAWPNRENGQVLLLNPIAVAARLPAENKVSDEWWTAFVRRANDIGAKIPKNPVLPGKKPAPAAAK